MNYQPLKKEDLIAAVQSIKPLPSYTTGYPILTGSAGMALFDQLLREELEKGLKAPRPDYRSLEPALTALFTL